MNAAFGRFLPLSRFGLAIAGGLALAASFPNLNIAGLAWIAPGVIVAAGIGLRGWELFRMGYVAGLALYLSSLHWLLLIPYRWHGIPLAPAVGWLSLAAFLALGTGAWTWVVLSIAQVRQPASTASRELQDDPGPPSLFGNLRLPAASWLGRLGWALTGAAGWVCWEMLITRLFGGFPWNMLGASQHLLPPLIQIASWTGVYGVSFLIVWFSLSLASAASMLLRFPQKRGLFIAELFLPAMAVAIAFSLGLRTIRHAAAPDRTIRVTLAQPSIPQTVIWDPAGDNLRIRRLLDLCEQALTNKTDLLIWPEAAIPKLLRYDKDIFEEVTGLARRHHVWMIVGADDAEPRRATSDPNDADYYNSSFLISPEGKLMQDYRKRSLVIFGEYIPLIKWLPFLSWFTPIQGGFTPGDKPVQFHMPDLQATASVLICYEDVFPQLGRSAAGPDTDFLVNLTNDGWFGESSAQAQQSATALFRTIENRRPLIRCTNNGLTCWIDAFGRYAAVFRDHKDSIYGEGFLHFELPFFEQPAQAGSTFYNRNGDVFGWACVTVTLACLALLISRWRLPRLKPSSAN